jgi:hypothetical protein
MSRDGQPLCVWTTDSGKFAAYVRPELLRRLAAEAWIGFKRVPRRGLEIGGLLLGRMDQRGGLTNFWIDGFELLESEHRSGPSYILSESDFARLDAMIARHGSSCLGMFRSHTRTEPPVVLSADADLIEQHFGKSETLFLILVPIKGSAALFARSEGSLNCVYEFALASTATPRTETTQVEDAQTAVEAQALPESVPPLALPGCVGIAGEPPDAPPALTEEQPPYSRKLFGYDMKNAMWVIAGMVIPLALVLATSMFSPSVSRSAARKNNPLPRYLQLTVDQAGKSLTLHWDPNSPAIQNAERAILHVEDGEFQTDRHLAQRDLQNGVFTYQPKSSGVLFQIEIYSQQPSAFGVVQATNLARAPAAAPIQSARADATTWRPPEIPARTSHADDQNAFSADQGTRADPDPKAVPFNRTQPPREASSIERSQPAPANRSPAAIAVAPTEPPVFASPDPAVSNPAQAPQPRLSVDVSTEPVSVSLLGRFVEKIPLLRRTRKPVTADPVPIHEAQPSLDSEVSKRIAEPVSIGVKVSVADTGAVKDAEVVDYGEPPNWSAANAALDAARHWTFQPARIEDAAVSSEIILRFRFRP